MGLEKEALLKERTVEMSREGLQGELDYQPNLL